MTKEKIDKIIDTIMPFVVFGGFAIVGGIIGASIAKRQINTDISLQKIELNHILNNAKNLVDDISVQVNKVVKDVYESEANKAFERRLKDISNDELNDMARKAVKAEVTDVLTKAADKTLKNYDVKEAIKDYIDDNSTYFDRKIIKSIRDMFDDDFIDTVTEAIEDKIQEA